jgi:FkbM family methyltransferase
VSRARPDGSDAVPRETSGGPSPLAIAVPARRGRGARHLDVIDGASTAVQRALRRGGLAGYEASTTAALLTLFECQGTRFTFFDVGSNIGLYGVMCRRLFPDSRVVAFEPTPATASIALDIARRNDLDVTVERSAVGRDDGEATLFVSTTSDASNSLVRGFKRSVGSETVPVVRLDTYVERTGLVPDVVKVDVEGHEAAALEGAIDVLERHRPALVIEVLHRRGRDLGVEITEVMRPLGYHWYRLSDTPTWRPEPRISGDPESPDRDWLLSPEPVSRRFARRYRRWSRRIAAVGVPERHHRGPPS